MCYFITDDEILGCILHMFCDTSNLAFASMIYLVTQTQTGYHSALVTSKSRVARQGEISLPRLELLGTLTGSQIVMNVQGAIDSDS